MRWIVLLSLITHFFLLGVVPQQKEVLSDVQVQYQFGEQLFVQGTISNGKIPELAQLSIQTDGQEVHQYVLTLHASSFLTTQLDLQQNAFVPFSRVYYWFNFTYADGTTFTSPSYWFDYIDNRFNWQTNESKWFNIYWVNGDAAYGETLQTIAIAGLKNATKILPVSPELPISIYVYPDSQALQTVVEKAGNIWIAGEARPELGVVLVSTSSDLTSTTELERQIPHELTHLVEYQLTKANYSSVPAWLLEGLATNAETYVNSDHARALQTANQNGSLIPLDQLCASFPSDSAQITLAYAESSSFVTYITNRFGTDKISTLLSNSGNGLGCEQLVNQSLGQSLSNLDSQWQAVIFKKNPATNSILDFWPAALIVLGILLPLLILRQRSHHRPQKENEYDLDK